MTATQLNGGTQIRSGTITTTQLASSAGITDGQLATAYIKADGTRAFTGTQSFGGFEATNAATPTSSTSLATKGYVDGIAQGLNAKYSARCATVGTETFTISSGSVTQITGTSVDGVSPSVNDFILIKDAPASTGVGSVNSTQPGNGLYIVTSNTTNLSVSRAADMSGGNAPAGAFTFVEAGTANASAGYVVSSPSSGAAFTYGTNNIAWVQFSGAGEVTVGNVLSKTANQISVSSMSTGQVILGNAGTPTITTLSGDLTVGATGTVTIGAGAVSLSKIASAAYNTTPTASTLAEWDANLNLSANVHIPGFTTTATAAGTTTLTVSTATGVMVWTGSSTQTVKLPTTGVAAGTQYTVMNNSSGNVTIQSSGANTILALTGAASAPFSCAVFTALQATPTTAAHWEYAQFATGTASGTVTSVSVASANGFAGSVATATSTPAITISTSVTGVLKGNGTAISAATAGTDYLTPASLFAGATVITGYAIRETPSGTVNSSNTTFTLAHTPISGTEQVFQNGLLQEPGGADYTISSGTITYAAAPATGDRIRVTYFY